MKRYKDWSPSTHDIKGLNCPERQDWFVLGVMRTRDSAPIDESNFACALERLGGKSDACMVAEFNHWACGWFEIILLAPEREADGQAIQDDLESYPILDEDDFSEREDELEFECWPNYGADEMIGMLAKNFELSEATVDLLQSLDKSSNGILRELHTAHSSHDYCMDDAGARYDFTYIDPQYHYWRENFRMSRDALAAFLWKARQWLRDEIARETREQEADTCPTSYESGGCKCP